MIAHGAGNQDLVAWLAESAGEAHPFGNKAYAAGIDEHAITVAAINHLGVARNDMNTRLLGHFSHAFADALQIGNGKAFFQDETTAEVFGDSPTRSNVVYRAAHRQSTNISAREEVRR